MIEAAANTTFPFIMFTLDEQEKSFFKKISKEYQRKIKKKSEILNTLGSAKSNLAGQIENEYYMESKYHNEIARILGPAIECHNANYNYIRDMSVNSKNCPLMLDQIWINLQKKYEYNPAHYHSGILSFVLWIDIPFLIENEKNTPNSRESTFLTNGCFYFLNPGNMPINGCGVQQTLIEADKKYEGKGLLFPSNMLHGVYPFYTSDKFRVSISGNFFVNVG